MTQRTETVVIGAGPAGLSCSHHLARRQRDHLVLDQGRVAETWRTRRWDGFRLNTPSFFLDLPGLPYDGNDPEGFLTGAETVSYLERYAASCKAPVAAGVRVLKLARHAGRFVLETADGAIEAANVVIATGAFQRPAPRPAGRNPTRVLQLHASEYRRPDQLPEGAVLVVGSGQSGCQIAHELNTHGRRVYLSLGRCPWVPLRYRARQFARWAIDLGLMEDTVDSLPRHARLLCNPVVGDAHGGHLCDPERLARDGVILIGRVAGLDGAIARVIPDAGTRLAEAATFAEGFKRRVDALIDARTLELPQELAREDAPTVTHDVRELDLTAAGVGAIVWANGYRPDFGWLGMPAFDRAGWPLQTRGVTAVPGLYFVGLPWLHKRKSALFLGVGEDAEHIVSTIVGDSPRKE